MDPIRGATQLTVNETTAYASEGNGEGSNRKARTVRSTNHFTARQLLCAMPVIPGVHHGLESNFWSLLWVVLRHARFNLPIDTCETVFPYGDDKEARDAKRIWLGDAEEDDIQQQLVVFENEPLTTLLFEFRALVRLNVLKHYLMTYDDVFMLFDAALAKEGWPVRDLQERVVTLQPPVVLSLVATPHAIPDSEAPHSTRRVVSAAQPFYDEQALATQRELYVIQPFALQSIGHRDLEAGVISCTGSKKRMLDRDIQESDELVAGQSRSFLFLNTRQKRRRVDTVSGDVLDNYPVDSEDGPN